MYFGEVMEDRIHKQEFTHPILLLLEYETILAYNKAPLSDRLYRKLRGELSEEWQQTKSYYKIVQ